MNPLIFSCPICGWAIYDEARDVSWMNEFRGLYTTLDQNVVLTGVGVFSDPRLGEFIAPPASGARWDDPSYESSWEHQFGAMSQTAVNGKRGFVFHEVCWSLVKRAFHPAPVPHQRLFEVLDSVPVTLRGSMDWGHDYGGLARLRGEKDDYFPWEYALRFVDRDFPRPDSPLAYSEVEKLLAETTQEPPPRRASSLPCASVASSGRDIFRSLPEELCCAIAACLPTTDLLNARRASRSFWNVFDSQQFWASRFKGSPASSERSWLFEAVSSGCTTLDWRWLYHRTVSARLGPAARNRKRVWGLIDCILEMLDLPWNELPPELPSSWQAAALLADEISPELAWIATAGCLRGHHNDFSPLDDAGALLKSQRVAIPTDGVSRIGVSTVRHGGLTYIAGLCITATSGHVLRFGYGPAAAAGPSFVLDDAVLMGFNVAVGPRGIHALQCVTSRHGSTATQLSAWLGAPDDGPRTERLGAATNGTMVMLELGFDGLKMVSLAAAVQPLPPTLHTLGDGSGHSLLRSSAIWYPDVPSPDLDLNEQFMAALDSYTWGYRPLFWSCFGGPGGIYLSVLEKVTIWKASGCMDFSFTTPDVPDSSRSFGRVANVGVYDDAQGSVEFLIDGPGGEVVSRVEICQEIHKSVRGWWGREGVLCWIKLSTNRGRVCEVGSKPDTPHKHRKNIVHKELAAAPGTAITGFYGAQYRSHPCSLMVLGVISERI